MVDFETDAYDLLGTFCILSSTGCCSLSDLPPASQPVLSHRERSARYSKPALASPVDQCSCNPNVCFAA